MTRLHLHDKTSHPYYIYAPDYRETSSGICVLHYLCHALNIAGHEAYVALCTVVNPQLRTPLLTGAIVERHKEAGKVPIVVYPEVITGNPLAGSVVVRYILNREGFLNGRGVGAADSDLFFYFAEDFRESNSHGTTMTVPVIDSQLFSPPTEPGKRDKSYLYQHRYPVEKIDFSQLPADIELLTFKEPKSLAELAEIFQGAKVLYSYEISTTCTLALLCGCPVIYFRGDHIHSLPFETTLGCSGAALFDEPGGFERARDSVGKIRDIWREIEHTFWAQFEDFVVQTQEAAGEHHCSLAPTVRDWLQQRTLSPIQAQLVADYQARQEGADLLIIVLDSDGAPASAMSRTLKSLDFWQQQARSRLGVTVFSPSPARLDLPVSAEWLDWSSELSQSLNSVIARSSAQWFIVLSAGDECVPSGMLRVDLRLPQTQALMVFCDEIYRVNKRMGPAFRPDINLDLLLSLPATIATHWLFRREAVVALGGFSADMPRAFEFDLILRMIEQHGLHVVEHIAEPLLISEVAELEDNPDEIAALSRHLDNRGYAHHQVQQLATRHYRVKYGNPAQPLVSILIHTTDHLGLLQRCVESILEKTRYPRYEVVIVDNDSETSEAINWLAGMASIGGEKVRIMSAPEPFNVSALDNYAARAARGEYLVLLSSVTAIIQEDWLDNLLNHALRPEVGIVGAKLLYPTGQLQHAGVLLGLGEAVDHPLLGAPGDAHGYMQRLTVDQNYSAVSAACLMVRRSVFDEVNGFDDDQFKVALAEVDLCLKAAELGYLTVWTPHCVLMHDGNVGQKSIDITRATAKRERFAADRENLFTKWLPSLAKDPAYNPNLSLNGSGFDVEGRAALTWRPLSWRPLPVVLAHPADSGLSANRRLTQPFQQACEAGRIEGVVSRSLLGVVELQRYQPDVILLQRRIDTTRLALMRELKAFSKAFKVLDFDQYPLGLEFSNSVNGGGADIRHAIGDALACVDRLVVPTPALAEIFQGQHPDIRVVPTLLGNDWAQVEAKREPSARPRVGCFMGALHDIDVTLIEPVLQALAGEVDWVFLDKAPLGLREYATETWLDVHGQFGPTQLAGLRLDLALIPLTLTIANHCRSNILALEYGACAIPVIASDVVGLRGALPLTRLPREPMRWISEIRAVLSDRAVCIAQGQQLCAAVRSDWILERDPVDRWLKTWLPA